MLLILIGIIVFALGAIFSYYSGIRALQTSRRLADYRVRRRYEVRTRGSLITGTVCALIAIALAVLGEITLTPGSPVPTGVTQVLATPSPTPQSLTSATPAAAQSSPTSFVITPSPIITATSASTTTPSLPIAVQPMLQGTTTPVFQVEIGFQHSRYADLHLPAEAPHRRYTFSRAVSPSLDKPLNALLYFFVSVMVRSIRMSVCRHNSSTFPAYFILPYTILSKKNRYS